MVKRSTAATHQATRPWCITHARRRGHRARCGASVQGLYRRCAGLRRVQPAHLGPLPPERRGARPAVAPEQDLQQVRARVLGEPALRATKVRALRPPTRRDRPWARPAPSQGKLGAVVAGQALQSPIARVLGFQCACSWLRPPCKWRAGSCRRRLRSAVPWVTRGCKRARTAGSVRPKAG